MPISATFFFRHCRLDNVTLGLTEDGNPSFSFAGASCPHQALAGPAAGPDSPAPCVGFSVPLGQWHNTECLESGTVFIECKDGAYEPLGEGDVMG